MTHYILIDLESDWQNLLPLTYTRPISELRCGILTLKEKWEHYLNSREISYYTQSYLSKKYPFQEGDKNVYINSTLLASRDLALQIKHLIPGQALFKDNKFIALCVEGSGVDFILEQNFDSIHILQYEKEIKLIRYNWDLFTYNGQEIEHDFALLTSNRESQPLSKTVTHLGKDPVFLEKGARVEAAVINTENGPVYIGKEAEVMEGCLIRGPFALGEHSTLKMGAKIYSNTSIGPHCKVGGEVNNSIFIGYANKAHDGFLGQAVIGHWCNLGADTNNSNLKNNYAPVKAWNYPLNKFINTGLQFCGLILGDHSKSGINTMFNTGTTVGVSCNIFGSGFPRTFIPSFSWGGASGLTTYKLEKALETARIVMKRRNIELDQNEIDILTKIFDITASYRNF